MQNSHFLQFQTQIINQLNQDIETLFDHIKLPKALKEACHYAMTGDGKRVRPLLVASSFFTVNEADKNYIENSVDKNFILCSDMRRAMLSVELLHAYSLVHDDLPCMDDDDLRRGRATTHIEYGEATALLAGDVLQTLAFEVFTLNISNHEKVDDVMLAALMRAFLPRARRMVAGQMLDLEGEKQCQKTLSQAELQAIHMDKTGALIEASVMMGAICAGATVAQLKALESFAKKVGLAFQVQDDILDVTADTEQLGKPSGSDEKLDKSTYVKLMGVGEAKGYALELFKEGKEHLTDFQSLNLLEQLVDWLWSRKK